MYLSLNIMYRYLYNAVMYLTFSILLYFHKQNSCSCIIFIVHKSLPEGMFAIVFTPIRPKSFVGVGSEPNNLLWYFFLNKCKWFYNLPENLLQLFFNQPLYIRMQGMLPCVTQVTGLQCSINAHNIYPLMMQLEYYFMVWQILWMHT